TSCFASPFASASRKRGPSWPRAEGGNFTANGANPSAPSMLARHSETGAAGSHLPEASELEDRVAALRAVVEDESAAIARLAETVNAQAADIRLLMEAVDKQVDNAKQQGEKVEERLGQVERIAVGHAPIIEDLEERVEHLEYIVPECDTSDDNSDRVSVRAPGSAVRQAHAIIEGSIIPSCHAAFNLGPSIQSPTYREDVSDEGMRCSHEELERELARALRQCLRGLRITHAALQSDFSALQSDCKILQANYGALQAECLRLQSTVSRLSSTIEHYKRNVAILKGDLEILKGRNGRMAQRVEELEADKLTRRPDPLLNETQGDSHREAEAQLKSSELEKMASDLANLRQDLAAAKQAQQLAEVQVNLAKDALLHTQGVRDKAAAHLVDAEKRATSAEARATAAEESVASAQERATAAEGLAASAQERAAVAEDRERTALVKLNAITADVAGANARAEDAEARATAIAEKQRILHAAHEKAELNAFRAAVMCKEAQKHRETVEAQCIQLRRELEAQNSIISSIKAQVSVAPSCLDQQANTQASMPPHVLTSPSQPTTAALHAESSARASTDVATEQVNCAPVTVQASIDTRDAGETESDGEVQQQDNLDVSLGEDGDRASRGIQMRKRPHQGEGTISASSSDNMPPGIKYNGQGLRICGWCKEDQDGKKNPRWCPSELGSGSICQKQTLHVLYEPGYVKSATDLGRRRLQIAKSSNTAKIRDFCKVSEIGTMISRNGATKPISAADNYGMIQSTGL
ncbi:hypothetical protein GGF50DRAFT_92982, partial [Schizophyllum commune]